MKVSKRLFDLAVEVEEIKEVAANLQYHLDYERKFVFSGLTSLSLLKTTKLSTFDAKLRQLHATEVTAPHAMQEPLSVKGYCTKLLVMYMTDTTINTVSRNLHDPSACKYLLWGGPWGYETRDEARKRLGAKASGILPDAGGTLT